MSAAALAVAAPLSASAATYVFDVSVTGAETCGLTTCSGAPAGFAPFSFQQTWTVNPTPGSSDGGGVHTENATGVATVTGLSTALTTLAGITQASPGSLSASKSYSGATGSQSVSLGAWTNVVQNLPTIAYFGDHYVSVQRWVDNPVASHGPLTAAGLADLVATGGTFAYYEMADRGSQSKATGVISPDYQIVTYTGMATFRPFTAPNAVPEPSSWMLLIVGFGGLGAVLRSHRRKPLAAA